MYCFNGISLLIFGLVVRRVLGPVVNLGALVYLAIDPTVAAQMPGHDRSPDNSRGQ
jgi:hypothetical protein